MRSPASGARRGAEWVFHALALALLALALREALRPAARRTAADSLGIAALPARLAAWVPAGAPDTLVVAADSLPGPLHRAWLRAVAAGGSRVTWRGDSLAAVALALTPVPHPRGGTRIAVAAPPGRRVSLGDAAGPLDTARASGAGGASLVARGPVAGVWATARGTARAAAPESAVVRRVLVLGPAGWEAKFAIAALEEDGWGVDARLAVAPRVAVAQGGPATPDTARHAAVVAVDSLGADDAARVARFVRAGGGLVLAGGAGRGTALAALAAGAAGPPVRGDPGALAGARPLLALTLRPVSAGGAGAVTLQHDSRGPAVVARRVGLGRVAQSGYTDTWRWRMAGPADGPAAHRAWWSGIVSAVAYAPTLPGGGRRAASGDRTIVDPAPYAALVDALGRPASGGAAVATRRPPPATRLSSWPLFLAIIALLLAEWGSRRFRGAR